MTKIRSTRQFKERIDAAFETQRVRDAAFGLVRVDTLGLKLKAKAA